MIKIIFTIAIAIISSIIVSAQNYDKAQKQFNQGLAKSYLEDYEGALQHFNKAIELGSNDVDNYYLRSLTKFRLEDYLGSRDDMIKVLKMNPSHHDALVALDALNRIIKQLYKF